jgi:glycosyltransferase involved in cell wall biosynthesis
MTQAGIGAERRKLLFVVPDLKGGGAPRVILSLLGALDAQRYDISLLNLGPRGQALESQIPAAVKLRRSWGGGLLGAKLATLWHGRDRDLLIAGQETRATFCVHWAAKLLQKPAAAWVHIAYEHWARGYSERHRKRSCEAYREIMNLVFVAEGARVSMRNWLSERHALPSARQRANWTVIPNLFRADNYVDDPAPAPAQHDLLQRMRTRPSLIGIGRLETRKGFDVLLRSAARALREGLDFDVVLLGEGPLRSSLAALASELGIAERVFMPGHVSSSLPWLRAATAYVLTSRLEGLPTTILEAFACGTPVIANDCPSGPSELLAGGRAGELVAMDDLDALALAMQRILQSPERRAQLRAAGLARVQHYDAQSVIPQWDQFIESSIRSAPVGMPAERPHRV